MGAITSLVLKFDEGGRRRKERLREAKDFLSLKQLTKGLCKEVKKHYDFVLEETSAFPEQQILDDMPPSLRSTVVAEIYGEKMLSVKLLSKCENQ